MSYPHLSNMARKYLGIVATSVPSERLFSITGNIVNAKRSLLDPSDFLLYTINSTFITLVVDVTQSHMQKVMKVAISDEYPCREIYDERFVFYRVWN